MTDLCNHVPDPLEGDGNSGIDLYIKVCEAFKRMRDLQVTENLSDEKIDFEGHLWRSFVKVEFFIVGKYICSPSCLHANKYIKDHIFELWRKM